MRRTFLVAALAAACGVACAQEDTNLCYEVLNCNVPRAVRSDWPTWYECGGSDVRKDLTERAKVDWPAGSEAIYLAGSEQLIIRNTSSNLHAIVASLLPDLRDAFIVIESQVFAFRISDVEDLLNGAGVTCETLMALRKKGRAKLVTTASATAKSGREVVVKNVHEVIYPTELNSEFSTNQSAGAWTIVPARFEMREIGTILRVVPEFYTDVDGSYSGLLSVMLSSEWVQLSRWDMFEGYGGTTRGAEPTRLRQPVVNVSSVQTDEMMMMAGETVLLGGGRAVDDDRMLYHFLRAEVIGPKILK